MFNILSKDDFLEAIKLLDINELHIIHTNNANILKLYPNNPLNIPKIECKCDKCIEVFNEFKNDVICWRINNYALDQHIREWSLIYWIIHTEDILTSQSDDV